MEYRVEQLAAATSLSVDTLRFYQARGLLAAPRRDGRTAIYNDEHLECLKRIRSLQEQGFTLSQIQRVMENPNVDVQDPLLNALRHESVGRRALSRDELATSIIIQCRIFRPRFRRNPPIFTRQADIVSAFMLINVSVEVHKGKRCGIFAPPFLTLSVLVTPSRHCLVTSRVKRLSSVTVRLGAVSSRHQCFRCFERHVTSRPPYKGA